MPEETIQTDCGKQYLGSALAYQVPLMQPLELQGHKTDCGNLSMPFQPKIEVPDLVLNNSDKWAMLVKSQEEAEALEMSTRDQSHSTVWHKERENRITASTFGNFMIRKADLNDKFVRNTIQPKSFKSVPTSYGKNSERVAINMYRKKTKNHVHECGFVVNPLFPFLGATPDGKVCQNGQSGILEVKCPYMIRDWNILDALRNFEKKNNLFVEEVNGEILLKRTHKYWYQVQGQLLVTGAEFCDFVTFTKNDLNVERIYPNKTDMKEILSKMSAVYVEYASKL